MTNIFYCHISVCKNIINHLCKKVQNILAMGPGEGMTSKNLLTQDSECTDFGNYSDPVLIML